MSDLTRNAYWFKIRDAFTVSTPRKRTLMPIDMPCSPIQNLKVTHNEASAGRILRMIALRLLARSPVRAATLTYLLYEDLKHCLAADRAGDFLPLSARRNKTHVGDAEIFLYPAEANAIQEVSQRITQLKMTFIDQVR